MLKSSYVLLLFSLFYIERVQSQTVDTLINVGTHSLHFQIVKGNGIPILFESGNGDDGSVWKSILGPIHQSTGATLITYDRAGLGKSEIDTLGISFEQEVRDLENALDQLGFTGELFVVSHSFGGLYSTLFANRHKKRVKCAVYIDVALPCFFTPEWSEAFTENISNENWELIKKHKAGLYYVLQNLEEIAIQMRDESFPDDIPVTLIAAEKLPQMVKSEEVEQWISCLKSFGSLPNHNYILAKDAGHKVWEDDPEIVTEEIIKLYNSTK